MRRMGTHTMGARDKHARDASANVELSALKNRMTRLMRVSSSLLSMLLSLFSKALLVVILPERLLWFILFVRERCILELEVHTRWIEFFFNSYVCTYVGPIQTGFQRRL